MISTLAWMSALAIGVAATVAGAAADAPGLHMALTAATAVGLAALALVQRRRLLAGDAGEAALSSATAIAMAVVWGWAALSLLITYVFVSTWGEWWQYVPGAGVVALLCLFFASTLRATLPPAARMRRCSTLPATSRLASLPAWSSP